MYESKAMREMHRLQPAIDVTPDEEDVRLIMAAPALLEAVKIALRHLMGGSFTTLTQWHETVVVLENAVAQAEGKEASNAS